MSMTNLLTIKSNNEIMADSLLNVQNIQLKDTTFAERSAHLGPELLLGVPVTGALVTAPYWGKPLLKPYKAWAEKKKNNVSYKEAWKGLTAQSKADKLSKAYLTENTSFWQGRKNTANVNKITAWNNALPKYDTSKKLSELTGKDLVNYNKRLCYKEAQRLIEEAKAQKLTGKRLEVYVRKITEAIAKGDAKVHELKMSGAIKPTSTLGKVSNWIKDTTKYNKLKGNILKSTKGASALRVASHGAKGMGIFAIISGLLEIPNLIQARQIDKAEKEQGRNSNHLGRQAVKSIVKVGANVLGYAAGAAAAGAVAGTVVPGLGNVAGAIIGFVGGCIGAMVTGYAADKAVGERTAAEEYALKVDEEKKKQANILAQEAGTNTETQNQLLAAMYEKIQSGEISDQEVISAFEKELEKRNSEVVTSEQQTNTLAQNNDTDNEYSSLLNELRGLQTPNLYYAA